MVIGSPLGIRGFSRRFAVIERSPASPKKEGVFGRKGAKSTDSNVR